MTLPNIDWSRFVGPPTSTLECRCGYYFRAHAKAAYVKEERTIRLLSKDPCPACGEHIMRAARGDPESMTL